MLSSGPMRRHRAQAGAAWLVPTAFRRIYEQRHVSGMRRNPGAGFTPGLVSMARRRAAGKGLCSMSCVRHRRSIASPGRSRLRSLARPASGHGRRIHAGGRRAACALDGLHPEHGDGGGRRHRRTGRPVGRRRAGRRAAASRSAARGMTGDTDCAKQVRAFCRAGVQRGRSESELRGFLNKPTMPRVSRLACAAGILSTPVPMRWLLPARRVHAGDRSVFR
jgi:hypothetical protein